MAGAQVVETSVTNNSLSQNSNHPDYLFQSRLLLIVELSTTSFWNFHIAVLFRLAQPWLPKMVSPCLVFSFLENVGVEPMLFKRTLKMALHNFVSWPPVRGNSKIATMLPLSRALASILQIMFTELLNQVHLLLRCSSSPKARVYTIVSRWIDRPSYSLAYAGSS